MEKKTEKAIRILIYSIVGVIALSMAVAFLVPYAMKQSIEKMSEETNKNIKKSISQVERKNAEIEVQKKIEEKLRTEKKVIKKEYKPVPVYSWINEKGQKIYSNTGFPEDKKYTDPKIEWQ